MATINGLYIWVESEQVSRESESASHPVEKGVDFTDHTKRSPIELSLKGKIVSREGIAAHIILAQIIQIQNTGTLVTYFGRNICYNMQIQSFNSDHPNTVWAGLNFDMKLKEVRIANSAYVPGEESAEPPPPPEIEPPQEITKGSAVIFTGGPVYESSVATKIAARCERSQCNVSEKIADGAPHPIHCKSTDGGGVYGWVDRANVELACGGTPTGDKANGGVQQAT